MTVSVCESTLTKLSKQNYLPKYYFPYSSKTENCVFVLDLDIIHVTIARIQSVHHKIILYSIILFLVHLAVEVFQQ